MRIVPDKEDELEEDALALSGPAANSGTSPTIVLREVISVLWNIAHTP